MNRRHFLKTLGLAAAAPAIVRAESLMRIRIPREQVLTPSYQLYIGRGGIEIRRSFGISGDHIRTGVIRSRNCPDDDVIFRLSAEDGQMYLRGQIVAGPPPEAKNMKCS